MRFIKDYMLDDTLRHGLNALTEQTFGFNFEDWVTNGYFTGDYIPYSFEENGKIISNVSVNRMCFIQNGEKKNYIQLGTVMTDEAYRKKGLARKLMECVLEEQEKNCDGIYLFANLDALGFYRKMGFQEHTESLYTLKADVQLQFSETERQEGFQKLDTSDAAGKKRYQDAVKNSVANGAFEQENKYGLQMFYTADLENVFYSKKLDCFAVLEKDGETIELQSVISQKPLSLGEVIGEISEPYQCLKLGFTPGKEEIELFDCTAFDGGEEYRLFCRGSQLNSIEREKLYFPTLSHA